ncbi:coproporphyrinogen III oxidase [Planoprotostelium fungivorum]|uniref:coproporphyrinogen oxidase n=1 Tax=Planoprotostelium fungivorum TaxID=1890364 RepID=A0A2P6NA78_9EUKA|nr:coproporphyrinogen III oxidase [Planoprotostelium fungivorum]
MSSRKAAAVLGVISNDTHAAFGADDIEFGLQNIQDHICNFLIEHSSQDYTEDKYEYKIRGGGRTRVWEGDASKDVLEKAGVNFSSIGGDTLPAATQAQIKISPEEASDGVPFKAMGVSLVIHPSNPHIPTIHMNIRYFECGPPSQPDRYWWFGGGESPQRFIHSLLDDRIVNSPTANWLIWITGIDLTPYWPTPGLFGRVINFHKKLKEICVRHNQPYDKYKATCDEYFTIPHRNEMRGVGGIFFDHLNEESGMSRRDLFAFISDLGFTFTSIYRPFIDEDRRSLPYNPATLKKNFTGNIEENEREWQLIRRGRYVEFNLTYDRGGRTESILMSLPTVAKWKYNYIPKKGSAPEIINSFYLQPQPWVDYAPENAHLYEKAHMKGNSQGGSTLFFGVLAISAYILTLAFSDSAPIPSLDGPLPIIQL